MKTKSLAATIILLVFAFSSSLVFASGGGPVTAAESLGIEKEATRFTQGTNKDLLKVLPFKDLRDFELAQKGFIARGESVIKDAEGNIIFSTKGFDFMQDLNPKRPPRIERVRTISGPAKTHCVVVAPPHCMELSDHAFYLDQEQPIRQNV